MDLNKSKEINATALIELSTYLNISDTELEYFITKLRNRFVECHDMKVSQAIPRMVQNCSMNDVMLGAILMCYMSDYTFAEYDKLKFIQGELHGN